MKNTVEAHLKICKELNLSPKHIKMKSNVLEGLMNSAPEKTKLTDWAFLDCFRYLELRRRDEISKSTYAREARILKSFWSWAENSGYIEKSPVKKLRLPPLPKGGATVGCIVQLEDFSRVRRHVSEDVYAALVCIWGCALRVQDLQRLREGDVNEKDMLLRCRDPDRFIPIPDKATLGGLYVVIAALARNRGGFVSSYLHRKIIRQLEKAKFPASSAAKLREAVIFRWGLLGVDPRNIKKWAGFKTFETTYKYLPPVPAERPPQTGLAGSLEVSTQFSPVRKEWS